MNGQSAVCGSVRCNPNSVRFTFDVHHLMVCAASRCHWIEPNKKTTLYSMERKNVAIDWSVFNQMRCWDTQASERTTLAARYFHPVTYEYCSCLVVRETRACFSVCNLLIASKSNEDWIKIYSKQSRYGHLVRAFVRLHRLHRRREWWVKWQTL